MLLIDGRLHLMKLRATCLRGIFGGALVRYHAPDNLLCVRHLSVDLVLTSELGMFANVLEVHLLYFPLQLFFLAVELIHIFAHKLLDVNIFIARAKRGFFTASCWTWLFLA